MDKEGNIKSRYDKVKLVPFSEFMPFPSFRNLWRSLGAPDDKFSSGSAGKILDLNEFQMGIRSMLRLYTTLFFWTFMINAHVIMEQHQ